QDARHAPTPSSEHERLLSAFAAAAATGDLTDLKSLLAENVITLTDGGGRKSAALNPIFGADKCARFLLGIERKFFTAGQRSLRPIEVNGAPGIAIDVDGQLDSIATIAVENGLIAAIYIVRNPEKLAGFTHH